MQGDAFRDRRALRRQSPVDADWRRVRYMIFEVPDASGSFTERVEQIKAVAAAANLPWLQAVPQFRLPDAAALQKKLRDIVRASPEISSSKCVAFSATKRNNSLCLADRTGIP